MRRVESSANDAQVADLRFSLLKTIRKFSLAELIKHDEQAYIQRTYAQYYLALAESLAPEAETPHAYQANNHLSLETDNIRAIMHWVLDH